MMRPWSWCSYEGRCAMNSTTVAESIDWIARVITLAGLLA